MSLHESKPTMKALEKSFKKRSKSLVKKNKVKHVVKGKIKLRFVRSC